MVDINLLLLSYKANKLVIAIRYQNQRTTKGDYEEVLKNIK